MLERPGKSGEWAKAGTLGKKDICGNKKQEKYTEKNNK